MIAHNGGVTNEKILRIYPSDTLFIAISFLVAHRSKYDVLYDLDLVGLFLTCRCSAS